MTRPIGYYVHHHGDGHRQRAMAIADCVPGRFTLIGTGLSGRTGAHATLDLPDDRLAAGFDGADDEIDRPHALHYAPLGHEGVRRRMGAIAAWIAAQRPSLMVVDVSVEVALLARLCATPVAYVRLAGRRDDPAHLEAFRSASLLVAPFAEALDERHTPDWIRRKSAYAPGIVPHRVDAPPQAGRILVVVGRGGSAITPADVSAVACATPGLSWRVIGLPAEGAHAANVDFTAWSDDPQGEIARAEIVVGGAGDGLVGAVLAAGRPFICIPEPRPYGEQTAKANALDRMKAALVRDRWPPAGQWSHLIAQARTIPRAAQAALDDPEGAEHLARRLIALADGQK